MLTHIQTTLGISHTRAAGSSRPENQRALRYGTVYPIGIAHAVTVRKEFSMTCSTLSGGGGGGAGG